MERDVTHCYLNVYRRTSVESPCGVVEAGSLLHKINKSKDI